MGYSRYWTRKPMDCSGPLDPYFDRYPECARPCLACPSHDWTYAGSNCAETIYNSSVPTPCCPVASRPWRFYHFEIWDCVWDQCQDNRDLSTNHDAAQVALAQWGRFCAEEKNETLYEYWRGTHFSNFYKMEGFDFVPLPNTEVAVSGYYGWGVLAAWHLALLAATVSGLKHIPPPRAQAQIALRSWAGVYKLLRRALRLLRWHLQADIEFMLAVVVVWIAVGDISIRGEKVSPMDVLAWPRIDAVPHGYDGIEATHLLTVRAAMGVVDNFICVAIGPIVSSWYGANVSERFDLRRPLFRTVLSLITILFGVVVTSRRGVCLKGSRFGCEPNKLLDEDVLTFGTSWRDFDGGQGKPAQLLHFVEGKWATWPIGERVLTSMMHDVFVPMYTVMVVVILYMGLKSKISKLLEVAHDQPDMYGWITPRGLRYLLIGLRVLVYPIVAFVLSFALTACVLGILFGFIYAIKLFAATPALLGPSPNVSFLDLDQILAVIVGGITALTSIWGSIAAFLAAYKARRDRYGYVSVQQHEMETIGPRDSDEEALESPRGSLTRRRNSF